MRDFNFFEPYIRKEKVEKKKKKRPFIIVVVVFLLIGTVYVYRDAIFNKIAEVTAREEAPIEDERMPELEQKRLELAKLKSADAYLKETNRIDEQLLNDITTRVPDNAEYDSISIGEMSTEIRGNAKTVQLTADYGNALKELEVFEDIFVTNSTYDEEEKRYSFILDIDFEHAQKSSQGDAPADDDLEEDAGEVDE